MHEEKDVQSMEKNLIAPWLAALGATKWHISGLRGPFADDLTWRSNTLQAYLRAIG